MKRISIFTNLLEFKNELSTLVDNCGEDKIEWCKDVIGKLNDIIVLETTNDILVNYDCYENISIACFYDKRVRIHTCNKGGHGMDITQIHTYDFQIPHAIDYLDSCDLNNNEYSTMIKIHGREEIFRLFVDSTKYSIYSIVNRLLR